MLLLCSIDPLCILQKPGFFLPVCGYIPYIWAHSLFLSLWAIFALCLHKDGGALLTHCTPAGLLEGSWCSSQTQGLSVSFRGVSALAQSVKPRDFQQKQGCLSTVSGVCLSQHQARLAWAGSEQLPKGSQCPLPTDPPSCSWENTRPLVTSPHHEPVNPVPCQCGKKSLLPAIILPSFPFP